MKGPGSPKGFYSKFLELLSVPLNGLLLYYQLLVLCVCIQKKQSGSSIQHLLLHTEVVRAFLLLWQGNLSSVKQHRWSERLAHVSTDTGARDQ